MKNSPGSMIGGIGLTTAVRDVQFLRAHTSKTIKITVPGPFTMAQQAVNEHYKDEESLAFAYADAVNEEGGSRGPTQPGRSLSPQPGQSGAKTRRPGSPTKPQ